MRSEGTMLPDRMEWRAQHVMLIAFPVETQLAVEQNWWADLTGCHPEESIRKTQKRAYSGVFQDVALSVEIDPFRVKWTVAPEFDPENWSEGFPTLGPIFERRTWLIELMGRWLQNCPAIKRLAFAGNLMQFVDSKEEAYRRLDTYLPGVEVDSETSDFMYRVNRSRDSQIGIKGLRVNRLCTGAAAKLTVGVQTVIEGTGEMQSVPIRNEQNACVLELDINTVLGSTGSETLPPDALTRIFTELVDLGLQSAEQGDQRQ